MCVYVRYCVAMVLYISVRVCMCLAMCVYILMHVCMPVVVCVCVCLLDFFFFCDQFMAKWPFPFAEENGNETFLNASVSSRPLSPSEHTDIGARITCDERHIRRQIDSA